MYQTARTLLAGVLIACLGVSPAFGASAKPLGVVVASEAANVGNVAAAVGATVFAGDALSTRASGGLRLRAGTAQVYLLAESDATLREDSGTLDVTLRRGAVRFSSSQDSPLAVRAANALIRPSTTQPTHSQVMLAGPNELEVSNFHGVLEVVVGNAVYPIPEGTSYRMMLESPEPQGPAGAGAAAARHAQTVSILLGAAIAGVAITFTILQNLSPSIP